MTDIKPLTPLVFSGAALLVGVETYDGLDADKQLHAGRNDVLAYWKVCRKLDFMPQNIRVLTSPVLTEQDLIWAEMELHPEDGEATVRARVAGWLSGRAPLLVRDEATASSLRDGVAWLADRLQQLKKAESATAPDLDVPQGFFAYSGHGARRPDGVLALCPRDVGPDLAAAVSFAELRDRLAPVDDNLTVVLDCCFAQASDPSRAGHRVATLASGPSPREAGGAPQEIAARVLCGSARDGQSYQATLGGYWYSAFTWALTVTLEQWKIAREGHSKASTISYGELLSRARKLLEALSFPQRPALLDEDRIGDLPAFHRGCEAHELETSEDPNELRPSGQIDPSVSICLGHPDGYLSDMEWGSQYWYVNWNASQSKRRLHQLEMVRKVQRSPNTSPEYQNKIAVGDTVRVVTTETRSGSSRYVNAGDWKNLSYSAGNTDKEYWIVRCPGRAQGEMIHPKDTLRLESVQQSKEAWDNKSAGTPVYLCRESDNRLAVRTADDSKAGKNIDWIITLQ
ncbi:caspase family protein [Sorangium sp. So ce1128]